MYYYETKEYDDLDGNRGIKVRNYVIEPSDTSSIIEQIKDELEFLDGIEELPEELEVLLYCSIDEELVYINIQTEKYLKHLEVC